MKNLQITDYVFKWIIVGLIALSVLTVFCPIYQYGYPDQLKNVYPYGSEYLSISSLILLVPILSLIFLLCDFKNNKLFSFGFSLSYLVYNICSLIAINRAVKNSINSNFLYKLNYGYYFMMIETILLSLAVTVALIIHLILKKTENNTEMKGESEEIRQSTTQPLLIVIKQRLDILNELKETGLLTENEYNEKRANIIKDLKI